MEAENDAVASPLTDAVEWFLDHLRVERGVSPHTVLAYANDLDQAVTYFAVQGVTEWTDLRSEQILAYEASLGTDIARATVLRRISALRSFLKFLKRNHAGPRADLPSTGGFRRSQRLPKALSRARLEALLDAAGTDSPEGLRDRALMELVYGAGLRVSEAVELEMAMLDIESASVRVTGKRGKIRYVPLPEGTLAWLKRYLASGRPALASRASSRVFLSNRGLAMRRQTVYSRMQRYRQMAGIEEHVSPHTLRHTYAVHLLKGGADLRAVQELLGHESVATTQIYTLLDTEAVRERYRNAHPRG